ncbi:MAG: glycosyltransferase family 2 protein [Gammaproteobacteria bacterium]|nr:glycosyltransferase family 2 protein [Gammaproteobacteria bacterium]
MSNTIKVTIIIPAFNEELFLSQCLDSVLKQIVSFRIEVLVIDDCSSDNTFAVAKSYAEKYSNIVKVFRNNENLGPRVAFLRGIKLSSADYFHMLDADDYWTYQYKLQAQVDFLDNHPDYSAVAHNTLTDNLKTGKKQQMINFDTGQLLANRPIDCATVMRGDQVVASF